MRLRPAALLVCFLGLVPSTERAQAGGAGKSRDWVSDVVTRISRAEQRIRSNAPDRAGTVTVRLRIDADGALTGLALEQGSGSANVDERAIQAIRAAAPFPAPPSRLLTFEGFTELSFPLTLEPVKRRR